jgi:dihydrofolate reductase
MKVILIAAIASNGIIGKQGKMPWHIPEDFKHFKRTTFGHPIILGDVTFQGIGGALPGRPNIVLSPSMEQPADKSFTVVRSLEEAFRLAQAHGSGKAYICGGAYVYKQVLDQDLVDELLLTEVKKAYEGDKSFPAYDKSRWEEVAREEHEEYAFVTYGRRKN